MKRLNLEGEFGWMIYSSKIREQLEEAAGDDLDIHIASPGGSVFEGIKVYNDFRDYKRKYPECQIMLTVKGLAASMASYLTMNPAFDMVVVEDNAILMIHNPTGGVVGDYRDASKFSEMLKGLTDLLAQAYAKKTKKSKKTICELMDNETWYFGSEIIDNGFADEIIESGDEKDKSTAIADAQLQMKALNQKLKELEINDNDIQEIAAVIDIENSEEFEINMPYPNEHAARVREPGDFQEDSFRRKNIETGIDIIIGRLKGKTTTTTQAYRFKKSKFTADQAKKWLKDHNIKYIKFEAASGSKDNNTGFIGDIGGVGIERDLNPILNKHDLVLRYNEQDPANNTRDNNINQEVKSMTLKEFLDQNPAAKIEYDEAIKDARDAGQKEIRDVVSKAAPFLSNSEYPKQIHESAVAVIKGEKSADILDSMVATADMIKEMNKSKDAVDENPNDLKPQDLNAGLSEEYLKDGTIMNEADMQAATKRQEVN